MGDLLKTALDADAVENGAWHIYDGNIRVKLASKVIDAYRVALSEEIVLRRAEVGDDGDIGESWWTKLRQKLVATHLVKDWGGEKMDLEIGGEVVPFSAEKAVEILTDPRFRMFWEWANDITDDIGKFRLAEAERTAENSGASLPG